jgi:hypothetical protein
VCSVASHSHSFVAIESGQQQVPSSLVRLRTMLISVAPCAAASIPQVDMLDVWCLFCCWCAHVFVPVLCTSHLRWLMHRML